MQLPECLSLDSSNRALAFALAAVDTFLVIDNSMIVNDRDSFLRAALNALLASDTADLAGLSRISTLIAVYAANMLLDLSRNHLDDMLRTSLNAECTADTFLGINNSNTVADTDSTCRTNFLAIAMT